LKLRQIAGGIIVKVYVNGEEIEIFAGARVKNALLGYSREEYEAVKEREKLVKDEFGNEILLDGSLSAGEKIFIEERDEKAR